MPDTKDIKNEYDEAAACGCGQDHDHGSGHEAPSAADASSPSGNTAVYILEGLDCANCAAAVERKISQLPSVTFVSVVYATGQMRVSSAVPAAELLPVLQAEVDSVEDGITVLPKQSPSASQKTKVYILEGLDCPNCAAAVERKLNTVDGVDKAVVTYATLQLSLTAADPDALIPEIQSAIDSVEDGITVVPKNGGAYVTKVYILQGLDCPGCANYVERKLSRVDGVVNVTITFTTLQMKLTAADPDALIPDIQSAIDAAEDGITVVPADAGRKSGAEEERAGNKRKELTKSQRDLVCIIAGAALFVVGLILSFTSAPLLPELIFLIASYLILGGEVLVTAGRNIAKGHVFDENFLMCIATLGAFAIQEFPEAVGVMLFYRIGSYFEDRATEQSRAQISEAVDLRPEVVNLVAGDDVKVIPAEDAKVGDELLVRPGDRIPLDGVVVEGSSPVDTSPVTGEPVPVNVKEGDDVTSGCINQSGLLKIRVEKTLDESMVTRILDSVENAAANKPAIDRFITRFARIYTPAVCAAAVVVAFILPLIIPSWHFFVNASYTGAATIVNGATGTASILTALTFLVISCPCALVLSVPLAYFCGIGAASRLGILFKGGNVLEVLARVKAVVMDKTGTITKGVFAVQQAVPVSEKYSDRDILGIAAACEQASTHPIAVSILAAAGDAGLEPEKTEELEELAGQGIRAKLSCGTVLCGNRKLMEANGVDTSAFGTENFGTEVLLAVNGQPAGYVVISDALKDDAADAVRWMKKQGISTAMLTGDAQDSAEHVASEIGLDEVHARLLPDEKLDEMRKVREEHGSTMFVGDGINDAPVLAGADVGAAMGSGADAAMEAADVVFMNSEMSAIPKSIDVARATRNIAWQNVGIALGIKLIVMVLGLCGFANMWVAVFADTGVSLICLLNSFRLLWRKF